MRMHQGWMIFALHVERLIQIHQNILNLPPSEFGEAITVCWSVMLFPAINKGQKIVCTLVTHSSEYWRNPDVFR